MQGTSGTLLTLSPSVPQAWAAVMSGLMFQTLSTPPQSWSPASTALATGTHWAQGRVPVSSAFTSGVAALAEGPPQPLTVGGCRADRCPLPRLHLHQHCWL